MGRSSTGTRLGRPTGRPGDAETGSMRRRALGVLSFVLVTLRPGRLRWDRHRGRRPARLRGPGGRRRTDRDRRDPHDRRPDHRRPDHRRSRRRGPADRGAAAPPPPPRWHLAPTTPPTTAATVPLPVAAVPPAGGCDPSYPGVCIPPGPPTSTAPTSPTPASPSSAPTPTASTPTTTASAAKAADRASRRSPFSEARTTREVAIVHSAILTAGASRRSRLLTYALGP